MIILRGPFTSDKPSKTKERFSDYICNPKRPGRCRFTKREEVTDVDIDKTFQTLNTKKPGLHRASLFKFFRHIRRFPGKFRQLPSKMAVRSRFSKNRAS